MTTMMRENTLLFLLPLEIPVGLQAPTTRLLLHLLHLLEEDQGDQGSLLLLLLLILHRREEGRGGLEKTPTPR